MLFVVVDFSLFFSVTLGLLLVNEVQTLGFDQLVKSTTNETGKDLLGLGVFDGLAVLFAMFIVGLESFVGSGTGNDFVGKRTLVFVRSTVDFFVLLAEKIR